MATKKDSKKVVSSDDAMEEPKTKNYNDPVQPEGGKAPEKEQMFIQMKGSFKEELDKTIGELGYNRELGSPEMHIQVFQIFDVVEKTKGKYLTEDQANQIISMIARAPYNVIAGLMKEITDHQEKFFIVKSRSEIEEEAKKASEASSEEKEK